MKDLTSRYISEKSIEYQKKVAVEMWQFVKKWYVKHPKEYCHPMWIKSKFRADYFNKTGQIIDWEANCILCEKYHCKACEGCPLYSGENSFSSFCDDYFKLVDDNFPFNMRPSICDKIIEAIKSFEG